jgi:hypothetical protein
LKSWHGWTNWWAVPTNWLLARPFYTASLRWLTISALGTECRFQTEAPNVVHMTVKPQEVVDEEDAKTGKGQKRDGDEESHAGCRCVIL